VLAALEHERAGQPVVRPNLGIDELARRCKGGRSEQQRNRSCREVA